MLHMVWCSRIDLLCAIPSAFLSWAVYGSIEFSPVRLLALVRSHHILRVEDVFPNWLAVTDAPRPLPPARQPS
jgi:hypothetical protein